MKLSARMKDEGEQGIARAEDCSEWIPPKSSSVVEFGCGEGTSGRAFLRIHPDCRYIGVDVEGQPLRAAKHHLSEAVAGNPATFDFALHDAAFVDCILYHDSVLRGMTGGILRRHMASLSREGQVMFLLENPGYFRRMAQAYCAQPSLPCSGMSLTELFRMAGEAGLHVFHWEAVHLPGDEEEKNRPETQKLLQAFEEWRGAQEVPMARDVWACRFVVRASLKPMENRLFLQGLSGDLPAKGHVRMLDAHGFLRTIQGVSCIMDAKGADMSLGEGFEDRKVIVRQGMHFEDAATALRQISAMRQAGRLIVYDLDDHPMRWGESYEKSWYLDFIGAHALQTSTPAMAEVLRKYNPHVKVLHNELRELPPRRVYKEDGPVTIFFGALNREQDWKDIMPELNRAIREHGDKIRFKVLSDKAFYEALQTRNKEFVGNDACYGGRFVPYGVYLDVLGTADISLLPLRDNEFNRMKSDIKFIESAAYGAVVLASPVAYGETVKDGRTGFLYRNPKEFRHRLSRLIKERPRRHRMAEHAYDYVRGERLLSQHYEERLAFYEELLARKDELDRELILRLARLAKRLAQKGEMK